MPSLLAAAGLSLAAAAATLAGGLLVLRLRRRLPAVMGFVGGALVGLVGFDILPEVVRLISAHGWDPRPAMGALAAGFLAFHVVEKVLVIHWCGECRHEDRRHPEVGAASVLALSAHSLLDGASIGLAYQASPAAGAAVALAVIGHDFVDGMSAVALMLGNRNTMRRAAAYLVLCAAAPMAGILGASWLRLPPFSLALSLSFVSGFLLYMGASHVLPEAHSEGSSWRLVGLTVLGAALVALLG